MYGQMYGRFYSGRSKLGKMQQTIAEMELRLANMRIGDNYWSNNNRTYNNNYNHYYNIYNDIDNNVNNNSQSFWNFWATFGQMSIFWDIFVFLWNFRFLRFLRFLGKI